MEKIMEFIIKYRVILLPVLTFVVGRYFPAKKFNDLGKDVAEKIPESLAGFIAERLDAFEQGLLNKDFRGDKTIVGNFQIKEKVKDLKIDLGLEGSKLKVRE